MITIIINSHNINNPPRLQRQIRCLGLPKESGDTQAFRTTVGIEAGYYLYHDC